MPKAYPIVGPSRRVDFRVLGLLTRPGAGSRVRARWMGTTGMIETTRVFEPALLVVTGVAGTGKAACLRALAARGLPRVRCFSFDEIGAPGRDAKLREFGGVDSWRADATRRWISRLARETSPGEVSVLVGRTRPSFVEDALARAGPLRARVVLLDCDPEVRKERAGAVESREPAPCVAESRAAYLRGQADALRLVVIDTTRLDPEAVADALEEQLAALRPA